jgi:tetratricopeptide (TPR) repeat protein
MGQVSRTGRVRLQPRLAREPAKQEDSCRSLARIALAAAVGIVLSGCGMPEESVEAPSRSVDVARIEKPVHVRADSSNNHAVPTTDIFAIKEKSSEALPAFEADGLVIPATLPQKEVRQSAERELGMQAAAEGRHQEAIEKLTVAVQENGSDFQARFVLANELAVEGKSQVALVHLKRILTANPKETEALVLRGMIRLKLTQFDEAAEDLLKAIDRPAPSSRALAYAAMAMLELGRNDEAERLATRCLEKPNKSAAIAYQVRGHARLRMKQLDAAAMDLAELEKLGPADQALTALRSAVGAARGAAVGTQSP